MPDYTIGKNVSINCPDIVIGQGTKIGNNVTINVQGRFILGRNSVIGDESIIQGRDIEIKREFRAVRQVTIGGGSCFESRSKLRIGYWGHLGTRSFVNTAESVTVGNEVGIGGSSALYTHGAYLDVLDGFPTQWGPINIGSHVWIPHATVHPGVTIGDYVVIGSHSLVTRNIPSGCLALGIPCRVIKEDVYPSKVTEWQQVIREILKYNHYDFRKFTFDDTGFQFSGARFDITKRVVSGSANARTEQLRHRLRRRGIRFKTEIVNGEYTDWESEF